MAWYVESETHDLQNVNGVVDLVQSYKWDVVMHEDVHTPWWLLKYILVLIRWNVAFSCAPVLAKAWAAL